MRAFALKALTAAISFAVGLALAETALRLVPQDSGGFRDTQVAARSSSRLSLPDWRGRQPAGTARVEVVNWSRPGWNTELQWQSVEPTFDALEPDLVLIGFVLNDAEPSSRKAARSLTAPLARRSPEHPISRQLHRYSSLYRVLWERLENTRQRRAFSAFYHDLYEGETWRVTRGYLQVIHDRAASRGAPVVLVIFPVFDSQLDHRYRYADIHRAVEGAAWKMDMYALDLLPFFRGVDAKRLANYPFTDPHPSELAHRIAADRIARFLERKGLVPGREDDSQD